MDNESNSDSLSEVDVDQIVNSDCARDSDNDNAHADNPFDSDSSFDGFPEQDVNSIEIDGNKDSDIEVSAPSSDDSEAEGNDTFGDYFTDFVEPKWTSDKRKFKVPEVRHFTQEEGPQLPELFDFYNASPLDYLELFIDDTVYKEIADNTNSYAKFRQHIKKIRNPGYRDKHWYPTDTNEIKAFISLNILFGVSPCRRIRHYWSKNKFLRNEGVAQVMSQRRFTKLGEYFHITDREKEPARGSPQYDSLFKVRSFMERLQVLFPMLSKPTKNQTIDEGLQPFQGRDKKVQYMPDKPKKRGFKVWIRCDSDTGYVQQFQIYTGKKEDDAHTHSKNGMIFDVVQKLTQPILNKNHHVYFDNFYTSIPTMLFLLKNNTYSCGTIQCNRRFVPPAVKEMKKAGPRGEIIMLQDTVNSNLSICAWRDTKVVRFCSTQANPNLTCTCQRKTGPQYIDVYQPHAASLYGKNMGGVDNFDHLRERYRAGRPGKKAWKYLFFFLLDASLVNAYILYKKTSQRLHQIKNYDQFAFRMELIPILINGFTSRRMKTDTKPHAMGPASANPSHANVRLQGTRKQCSAHRQKNPEKPRHLTVYGCQLCGVHLCKNCHRWVHS